MRAKLVAGNWKMHGNFQKNSVLLTELKAGSSGLVCEAAVFVPFPYLAQVEAELAGTAIAWGAQNLSEHQSGAYTGEVSSAMLRDFDCRYVLVGHSERRSLYGEQDELVAAKFLAAQAAGLVPVLCLGETLQERESGATEQVVFRQLDAVLRKVGVAPLAKAVLAYEPVWAIGTGLTASPEQAQQVHSALRSRLAALDVDVAAGVKILYGGSVKAQNAAELFACADIDGALVGGASLDANEFLAICRAAG